MEEPVEMDTVNPVIPETCQIQSVSYYTNVEAKTEVLTEPFDVHSPMNVLPNIHVSGESQDENQVEESISNPQNGNAPEESSYSTAVNNNTVLLGEKTFSCKTCGNRFSFSSSLSRHKRIHTSVRPFACDQCDKKFSINYDLVVHKRVHSKPFACDQCEKKFVHKFSLVEHKRTHTVVKPFSSDKCGKSFTAKSILSSHLKNHSN